MPWPVRKNTLAVLVAVSAIHAAGIWVMVPGSHQSPDAATRPVLITLRVPELPVKETTPQVSAAPATAANRTVAKPPPAESQLPRHTATATATAITTPTTAAKAASDLEKSSTTEPVIPPSNQQNSPASSLLKEGMQTVPQGVSPKPVSAVEAPAAVEPPLAAAEYLHNPPPAYPSLSLRLQEQGQVVHRVLIGLDGKAISAQLLSSSGSDRLDRAAREAVMQWRYVPGKRGGSPTVMSVDVPITWRLN